MSLRTDDLGDVYGAKSPAESRTIYDGWAAGYDADNLRKGFRLPGLAAGFAARYLGRGTGPVLDAGCGTGLVGEALALYGIGPVVGLDLSPGMLAAAQATGAYDRLVEHELGTALPDGDDTYAGALCIGSFGPGHAPPETLTELARVVRPGGPVIFNLLPATYEDQGFPPVMERLAAEGRWREAERTEPFRTYLLGEADLLSVIFVFEVA